LGSAEVVHDRSQRTVPSVYSRGLTIPREARVRDGEGTGGAAELRGGEDPDSTLVLSAAPDAAVDGVVWCSGSDCLGVADDVAEVVEVEAPGGVLPAEDRGDRALSGESGSRACAPDAAPDGADCARSK
jgi:hypothetical protein